MDKFDANIRNILTKEMDKPQSYYNTIKYALNKKKTNKINIVHKSFSLAKFAVATCFTIVLTTGIAFAAKEVYKNIWKEPEKVENYYASPEVTDSEKKEAITEEAAREVAQEILKRFGFENEIINKIELTNSPVNYELRWNIETKNQIKIFIDAKNTNTYTISTEMLFLNRNIRDYRGTRESVEITARKLCEKYGYDLSKYNYVEIQNNAIKDEDAYIWNVGFYKKYDELVNRYEEIKLALIPGINEIYYFIVNDNKFENNEVEISEEQAKQIAIEFDRKVPHGCEIRGSKASLGIEAMNGEAYTRQNNYEQYYKQSHTENYPIEDILYHRTERKIRKCWRVTIIYNLTWEQIINEHLDSNYTYLVDCTTGEVIGGSIFSDQGYNEIVMDN